MYKIFFVTCRSCHRIADEPPPLKNFWSLSSNQLVKFTECSKSNKLEGSISPSIHGRCIHWPVSAEKDQCDNVLHLQLEIGEKYDEHYCAERTCTSKAHDKKRAEGQCQRRMFRLCMWQASALYFRQKNALRIT